MTYVDTEFTHHLVLDKPTLNALDELYSALLYIDDNALQDVSLEVFLSVVHDRYNNFDDYVENVPFEIHYPPIEEMR